MGRKSYKYMIGKKKPYVYRVLNIMNKYVIPRVYM